MMGTLIRVKIADFAVLKEEGVLLTIGLGSCVGIALYDQRVKVAGMAHILLADSTMFLKRDNLAKFADTAVPLLLEVMKKAGAHQGRITAKIAGGSELFRCQGNHDSVGGRNITAVRQALVRDKIPLLSEDVGGNLGRTMKFFAESGKVFVAKVGQCQKEL